ncbi:MAG: ankyrin repeat domain-containing protein [Proteobacteria bacterium]|nr:MAG: ankyrin repeat domain-containing protein [Pseudomonadota bacterium]
MNRLMGRLRPSQHMAQEMIGFKEMIGLLQSQGADINALDKDGLSPLMIASRELDVVGVQSLLAKSASVDLQDKNGYTALMWAVRGPGIPTSQAGTVGLDERKRQLHQGMVPLRLAVVKALIAAKAKVLILNNNGQTAVDMLSERSKNRDEVRAVLEKAELAVR